MAAKIIFPAPRKQNTTLKQYIVMACRAERIAKEKSKGVREKAYKEIQMVTKALKTCIPRTSDKPKYHVLRSSHIIWPVLRKELPRKKGTRKSIPGNTNGCCKFLLRKETETVAHMRVQKRTRNDFLYKKTARLSQDFVEFGRKCVECCCLMSV
ncbi:hypothetical protein CEXT_564421 [Caerostris extrusa]|uniref:Uncharacterized protein n=1 Tax=Caerostris extrusa TaxID=172846 RepID=A0AAV4WFJ5_CAEEX|nr:hypothetical protein CEXT_564421 [Caerostris extrusa]